MHQRDFIFIYQTNVLLNVWKSLSSKRYKGSLFHFKKVLTAFHILIKISRAISLNWELDNLEVS